LIYVFACFSGLAIGLYLINQGAELIGKPSNRRLKMGAYLSDAMAYGGYAICLITPFSVCVWLFTRIVVCHGSPFI
jgi:hypothetical protein